MKKVAIEIAAIGIMLLMVSTVTAVPHANQQTIISEQKQMQDTLLAEFRNSSPFVQIEQIVHQNFPADKEQFVHDSIVSHFSEFLGSPPSSLLVLILMILAEAVMLLLGHNIVGATLALLVTSLAAVPGAFIRGFGVSLGVDVVEFIEMINKLLNINWADMIYAFGIIGAAVAFVGLIAFCCVLMLFLVVINIVVCIGGTYIEAMSEILDFIMGGGSSVELAEQQQVLSAIQSTPLLESLNTCLTQAVKAQSGQNTL